MQREPLNLTEEDGYEALREHVRTRARAARARYGPVFDEATLRRMLGDAEVVRFPTDLAFDSTPLLPGEFGWAQPKGERPADGFTLVLHPCFRERPESWAALVAYHVVAINYLDIATHVEAELYGATLLGLEVDEYYGRVCALADSMPKKDIVQLPGGFETAPAAQEHRASSGSCSSCNCGGGA